MGKEIGKTSFEESIDFEPDPFMDEQPDGVERFHLDGTPVEEE